MSTPAPFRLYNTLTRRVEDFEPIEPGVIRLYVCGMTVYDECHVGHARAMVWFDVVARYLRHRGWDVRLVRNFTDVDDKIIQRASATGEDAIAYAERYIRAFHRDADGLGLARPTAEPKVSESIPDILALIERLIERDHAYASAGSVWFSVDSFPSYGKLSGQRVEELRGSADGGDKRSPNDFALWKGSKEGEPAWESPWGPGRPGWHIECSAMACATLGDQIDIHGGGLDLVFPHHENEVAQSECGTGHAPFARYWMHNGLLTMASGQKMGKSLGNVVNIVDLLQQFPAEALRLYYLQNHYHSPLPWDGNALPDALAMLARLYEAREVAEQMGGEEPADEVAKALGPDAERVLELGRTLSKRCYEAMDEDFNTAETLGYAFELARAINRLANHKKARKRAGPVVAPALKGFAFLADALGLLQQSGAEFSDEVKVKRLAAMGISRADVDALLAQRDAARVAKDWPEADRLRDELTARRIVVMDGPEGATWKVDLGAGIA